ncbi:hypothetical protein [uncultured Mucilaginibacter sp.]|uniref:hypothetical protein n=1 Tax=uncultured Mucilaginibacter sp. TaxID=797541 RepID=UPI0025F20EB9|nr:hypothetical protein [uncultured Mucilaginibacter sp.]
MDPELTALGVPEAVQAFFDVPELMFNYGGHFEHFGTGFHRVPTTPNLWLAGKELAREVIITSTAMEAIAYLSVNLHRYSDLDTLSFIALGNLPHYGQLQWIKSHYPKRKFTLVFGKDLLGRLADIRVAAGLKNQAVRLLRTDLQIQIMCNDEVYRFDPEVLSLSAFEKASGLRTGFRTSKPKEFDTYLEQLKYHANQ